MSIVVTEVPVKVKVEGTSVKITSPPRVVVRSPGPQGPTGDISAAWVGSNGNTLTVAASPPSSPIVNDLWVW